MVGAATLALIAFMLAWFTRHSAWCRCLMTLSSMGRQFDTDVALSWGTGFLHASTLEKSRLVVVRPRALISPRLLQSNMQLLFVTQFTDKLENMQIPVTLNSRAEVCNACCKCTNSSSVCPLKHVAVLSTPPKNSDIVRQS